MTKTTSKKPAEKKPGKPVTAAPQAAPARPERRAGLSMPKEGTLCRKVWDALDTLRADGKGTSFSAVRELVGTGAADATIRTQRQRWNTYHAREAQTV